MSHRAECTASRRVTIISAPIMARPAAIRNTTCPKGGIYRSGRVMRTLLDPSLYLRLLTVSLSAPTYLLRAGGPRKLGGSGCPSDHIGTAHLVDTVEPCGSRLGVQSNVQLGHVGLTKLE